MIPIAVIQIVALQNVVIRIVALRNAVLRSAEIRIAAIHAVVLIEALTLVPISVLIAVRDAAAIPAAILARDARSADFHAAVP